jgi:hypothetical protein
MIGLPLVVAVAIVVGLRRRRARRNEAAQAHRRQGLR